MECPCCFQELPDDRKPRVSLESNVLIWSGLYTQFRPKEAEMLYILSDKYPAWVDRETLIKGLWGTCGDAPMSVFKILSVMASTIREKFQENEVPMTIENGYYSGQGSKKYRLRYL